MNCRREPLEILVRRVLPQVLPCPKSMVLDALQAVAVDFCKTSEAWSERLDDTGTAGENIVAAGLPGGVELARVRGVWIDGGALSSDEFRTEGNAVVLSFALPRDCAVTIDAVLRPSRLSVGLPHRLMEEWGDVLACGALARLKAMSGKNIEWSDGQGAAVALQHYNEGTARARVAAIRACNRARNGSLLFAGGDV